MWSQNYYYNGIYCYRQKVPVHLKYFEARTIFYIFALNVRSHFFRLLNLLLFVDRVINGRFWPLFTWERSFCSIIKLFSFETQETLLRLVSRLEKAKTSKRLLA
jgi:hypothetical protein